MCVCVCVLSIKEIAKICSFLQLKIFKNNEIATILKTHAVDSLFYSDLILQQKWSHMRVGLKEAGVMAANIPLLNAK